MIGGIENRRQSCDYHLYNDFFPLLEKTPDHSMIPWTNDINDLIRELVELSDPVGNGEVYRKLLGHCLYNPAINLFEIIQIR